MFGKNTSKNPKTYFIKRLLQSAVVMLLWGGSLIFFRAQTFDDAIYKAGRERFRAIFLTSITTMAGLAPIILEKSFQAQLLKPMAISIAYGIGYATFLTLILLPILISITNTFKVKGTWLMSGKVLDKRDVESPVVELNRKK